MQLLWLYSLVNSISTVKKKTSDYKKAFFSNRIKHMPLFYPHSIDIIYNMGCLNFYYQTKACGISKMSNTVTFL